MCDKCIVCKKIKDQMVNVITNNVTLCIDCRKKYCTITHMELFKIIGELNAKLKTLRGQIEED